MAYTSNFKKEVQSQILEQMAHDRQSHLNVIGEMDFSYNDTQASRITCEEIREIIKLKGKLIDVRSPKLFLSSKLHRAVNIPLQHIEKEAYKWLNKELPILIYSDSGMKSHLAVQKLKKKGFNNITNIGKLHWYSNCL